MIMDRGFNKKQSDLNKEAIGGILNVKINVSPLGPIFKGSTNNISVTAVSSTSSNITIKKNNTNVYTESNKTTITYNESNSVINEDITFSANASLNWISKDSESYTIKTVYPIYYGSGDNFADAKTIASARFTPEGVYSINATEDGKYILFVVPNDMNINRISLGGIEFPIETAVRVSITDDRTQLQVPYKVYKSSNTYDKGTYIVTVE